MNLSMFFYLRQIPCPKELLQDAEIALNEPLDIIRLVYSSDCRWVVITGFC